MHSESLNRSKEHGSHLDLQQITQRLNEVHRLMEQLEDRVLFDAAADVSLITAQEPLDQVFQIPATVSGSQFEDLSGSRNEIVFIDPTVDNADQLLTNLLSANTDHSLEVRLLDGSTDGVQQIASALSGRKDIDAVHIISHGDAGALRLGSAILDAQSMA